MIDSRSIAGTILGALRSARGVNQSVIATACGRSSSHVSNWENGRIDIPNQVVGIYSEHLNIPEQEIWDLINFWQKADDNNPAFQGNTYFYPTFRDQLFNKIKSEYYQEPLNPRTRRDLGRRF